MKILKSLKSILFQEGLGNFIKRKSNKTFLDSRTLFTINYKDRKTKIYLNKKFGYLDSYIFENGIYEKEVIDCIYKTLDKSKTMLDIGSNIGQHSLILAPYCKEIYAFEPIPDIYNEFQASIKANQYKNIHLFNSAIGNTKQQHKIKFFPHNTGASSLIDIPTDKDYSYININIDRLENLLPKDLKFDVVKIDVEGYEAVVLIGNKDIFLKNRPIIFLEYSNNAIELEGSYKSEDLLNLFFENNYEIYSWHEKKWHSRMNESLMQTSNIILKPVEIEKFI